MKGLLQSIIDTLDKIEVRGKDNCNKMLGCIGALEQLRDAAGGVKVTYIDDKGGGESDDNNQQTDDARGQLD